MIAFRDDMVRRLGLDLLVHTNEEGRARGINPITSGSAPHTAVMKTEALQAKQSKGKIIGRHSLHKLWRCVEARIRASSASEFLPVVIGAQHRRAGSTTWPPGCTPDAQIDAGTNFRHYAEIAQTAEHGKFDLMFVADGLATRDGKLKALSRWPQYIAYFDPLTLLPALAPVTTHIGLCATATTSYNEPYHLASKVASLDHISGGLAGVECGHIIECLRGLRLRTRAAL
jgi:hypothetical protein